MQGFLIGVGLAFVTAQAYARIKATKVNGWITMFGLGVPGNGMLLRAAHAQYFPGPVNVPEEAMYWWANADGAGHTLNGEHDYMMHFPPGGLPPNDAFWSLTMGDANNRFVANPINRYSVWFLFIYFWPRMMLYVYKRAILVKGFGDGHIPVN